MEKKVLAYFASRVIAAILAMSVAGTPVGPEKTMIIEYAKTEQADQFTRDWDYIQKQIAEHDEELAMLAKLIYREARSVNCATQQAAVVWCVLNRVDSPEYPNSIAEVVTQKNQFAYSARTPVMQEYKDLATDVFARWQFEKLGYADVGRVLPKEYLFFTGYAGKNRFRTAFRGGTRWDWSRPSQYED